MRRWIWQVLLPIHHDVLSDRSSMMAAESRALLELSEPCLGWTREPRGQTKSLGACRQYSQATVNNVLLVMTGSPAFLTRPPPGVSVWSEFTGWAIIEELSIRRRLRTFLISCGQKTRVKHCYVDLSSWYELWLAIICIDSDVIFDLSIPI